MKKQQHVLLLNTQSLMSEGIERLLKNEEDVNLISTYQLTSLSLEELISIRPDVVVITEDCEESATVRWLIAQLVSALSNISIVWVGVADNVIHVYVSHTQLASSSKLIEIIKGLSIYTQEN